MRFQDPDVFSALWLVLFLCSGALLVRHIQRKKILKHFSLRNLKLMTASRSDLKIRTKFLLEITAMFLIVMALARPQIGQGTVEIKQEGFEIILLVDVSESMMAEDLKPHRLSRVKMDLERFVDSMPGYRMGLVAFAGSAALLSPLTNDPAALKMYIDSLDPSSVSSQGTSFSSGIKMAIDAFERGGITSDSTTQVTRVIMMFSDGEDHEPGDLEIAQQLGAKKIRLFTVAYGTEKGSPIPVRDQMGYMRGYKQDENQNAVISRVDGAALKKLAETGQGTFSFAVVGGNHLNKIIEDLSVLEKTQYNSATATQYQEKYQLILFIALLCLLVDLFLSERKHRSELSQVWKGRFL